MNGSSVIFFFNDTATTEIYTLSLHDALPIYLRTQRRLAQKPIPQPDSPGGLRSLRPRRGVSRQRRRIADQDGSGSEGHLRSEEHTSELQSPDHLVCRLLLENKITSVQSHSRI